MTLKSQLKTIKDNWLIAAVIVVLAVMAVSTGDGSSLTKMRSFGGYAEDMAYSIGAPAPMMAESVRSMVIQDGGFAPDVQERRITKTASMTLEVKRGEYQSTESKLKSIVMSSDSILLNENVWKQGTKRKQYFSGQYTIQVETGKYDAVVSQLRELGKVEAFQENALDVTERYTDLEIELATEKERLLRYEAMYKEATRVEDKINLNDRIFNQERTIKYLEESLKNIDERIEYTSVTVMLNEKKSEYMDIAFVKVSELVGSLVNSVNSVLRLIFVALPYAIIAGIGWIVYRFMKRRM